MLWVRPFHARAVLGVTEPKVAVLSVGEERAKGNAQVIEAARFLDAAPVRFIGNIEGKDIRRTRQSPTWW